MSPWLLYSCPEKDSSDQSMTQNRESKFCLISSWEGLRRFILQNQFRNIGTLALGALVASSAGLLAMPLLTRLYTPADFGNYALFVAVLGLLAPVSALRLDLAILLPERDSVAWTVFLLSIAATLSLASLVLAFVVFFPSAVLMAMPIDRGLYWLILLLPIGVLLAGFYQAIVQAAIRLKDFSTVAVSRGGQALGTVSLQAVFGFHVAGAGGLVIGDLLGRLVSCLLQGKTFGAAQAWRNQSPGVGMIDGLRSLLGFPMVSAPAALLSAVATNLPVIIVAKYFGLMESGLFLMGQKLISIPTTVLITPFQQVFNREFSECVSGREMADVFTRSAWRAAFIGIPIFFMAAMTLPFVAPFFLGKQWAEAGVLASLFAPYYLLQLVSGSTSSALELSNNLMRRLSREIVFLIGVCVIMFFIAIWGCSIRMMVVALSVFGACFYAASLVWIYRVLLRQQRK